MKEAEIRPQKLFNEYLALAEKDVARFKETAEARRVKLFRPRAQLVDQWSERVGLAPRSV